MTSQATSKPTSRRLTGRDRRRDSLMAKMIGVALLSLVPGLLVAALIEWGSSTSHAEAGLLITAGVCAVLGWLLFATSRVPEDFGLTTVFATVAWTWLVCSVVGALPFWFDSLAWDSALFEAISGFSCTGSTVLADIESHGRGVLMWRQLTQWYGGMGMVVLAVSVLPKLRVGGLELIGAEAPGQSDRLEPRVRQTARWLWYLYCAITAAIALALWAAPGPSLYDAVAHALATAATGGFSPYNASVGHFDSFGVELIIALGLLVCAVSFSLHHSAVRGKFALYWKSSDTMFFFKLLAGVLAGVVCLNVWWGDAGWLVSARDSFFNVVSLGTSGGFGNVRPGDASAIGDFALWVPASQLLLLGIMVVGGNVGSTSGGLKAFRGRIALLHIWRNLRQTIQPKAVLPLRSGGEVIPEETVRRVLGFTTLYVVLLAVGSVIVTLLGADLLTGLSGTLSAMSNMGPALGEAGPTSNFLVFTRPARLVLAAFMLIGRLEIMAILLMFAPLYRRVTTHRS